MAAQNRVAEELGGGNHLLDGQRNYEGHPLNNIFYLKPATPARSLCIFEDFGWQSSLDFQSGCCAFVAYAV